jgi:hypothetical protein
MKKLNLLKAALIFASMGWLLMIAGCSSGGDTITVAGGDTISIAYVVVQLADFDDNPYLVDGMSVSIQRVGDGSVLTGVTGTDGIARILVLETGDYEVIQVAGVDATNLAQDSDTGREFVKGNPIADPYPNLTYSDDLPTVTVTALDASDYSVSAQVPTIIRVTVLKVGSVNGDNGQYVTAGDGAFAGRVMLSNFYSVDQRSRISIQSNDTDYYNRLGLAIDTSGVPFNGVFISDSSYNIGSITTYTQAGPIYFEAPGTDNGDWALGCNLSMTDLHNRDESGGEDYTRNFLYFNGGEGEGYFVFRWNTVGDLYYSYDYRIFKFDECNLDGCPVTEFIK